jgi:ankyrin repeat protein
MHTSKLASFFLGAAVACGGGSNCPGTEEDRRAVLQAAFANDAAKMEQLLTRDASLANLRDCTPVNRGGAWFMVGGAPTPLHLAARQGHTDVARVLLAHGASVDPPGTPANTPLHFAAQYGHDGIADLLLAHRAPIEAVRTGMTPLHLAAFHGRFLVVKRLIAAGARVDLRGPYRWTSLHYAASNGHAAAGGLRRCRRVAVGPPARGPQRSLSRCRPHAPTSG